MSEAYGFSRFGGPDVQEFLDRPDPVPGRTDVVVRVIAAGVNPLDHKLRAGAAPEAFGDRTFPYVLGVEASGVALAVGSDVEGIAVDDAVFGFAAPGVGTYAATTLLTGPLAARKPEEISDRWAATIPIAGTTALNALDQIDLPGGSTVLINGVGGGVGLAAAQIALARGLRVIGTGSGAKRTIAASLGIAFVDRTVGDVASQVRDLAPPGVDGLIDTAGGKSLRALAPLAGDLGKVISVTDPSVTEFGGQMVRRRLGRPELECVAALMVEGRLDPHVTATYPLSRAGEALAAVEGGHALGKVVLDLGAHPS